MTEIQQTNIAAANFIIGELHKDGRKSFWLLSYVQAVVTNISESDTVAA